MKIKSDEITSVIKQEIEQYSAELSISEVGKVVEVGDGIARVYGLSNVMAGELLEFQGEQRHGHGPGHEPRVRHRRRGSLRRRQTAIREGDTAKLDRSTSSRCPSARSSSVAWWTPSVDRSTAVRPSQNDR